MMRFLFIAIAIFLQSFDSRAEEKIPTYRNWKTFRSDYGYEFKYPDCWKIYGDGPDEPEIATSSSKEASVGETDSCRRPKMAPDIPNGIGVYTDVSHMKNREEALKEIESLEKHADNNILRNEWRIYRRLMIEGGEGFVYVENNPHPTYSDIRWKLDLYCSSRKIRIVGPTIRNPDESYNKRFKAGDLALPEPEKTIYESIRCVEPKKKDEKSAGKVKK